MAKRAFSFFGKVDRNDKNAVCSEYPAYMLAVQREKLSEDINSMKRRLRSGEVELEARVSLKEEIQKSVVRLGEIDRSRPKITAPMKDKMSKHYKELSVSLSEVMFSLYEEHKGLADAHEEVQRMHFPCVEVNSELAKAANLSPDKESKVSRNDATKLWKIMGHILGLPTNPERLRKQQ